MPAWTDYTSKTTPADTDEVMIKDFSDSNKANKRMLFSGLWNWIVNKLTNAVIANLETSPQTIVGAINSLNSKTLKSNGKFTSSFAEASNYRNTIVQIIGATDGPTSTALYGTCIIYDAAYIETSNYVVMEFVSTSGYVYRRSSVDNGATWRSWNHYPNEILSDLTTTAKDSLVSAVNELDKNKASINKTQISLADLQSYIVTNKKGNFIQSTVHSSGSAIAIVSPFNNYQGGYCSFIVFGYNGIPTIYKLVDGVWDGGTALY